MPIGIVSLATCPILYFLNSVPETCRRESQGELTLKPSGNMSYETCVGEGTNNYILVGHAQMTVRPAGMLIQWA